MVSKFKQDEIAFELRHEDGERYSPKSIVMRKGYIYPAGTFRPLDEALVRDMVGAPDIEDEKFCTCGELLETCDDAYSHMSKGA